MTAAAEEFLQPALDECDRYWSGVCATTSGLAMARGQLDGWPSVLLRQTPLAEKADGWVRALADAIHQAADPATGLVPYPFDGIIPTGLGNRTGGNQTAKLVGHAARAMAWTGPDPRALALAEATAGHFDCPPGIWGWVNASTGAGVESTTLAVEFGVMLEGMVAVGLALERPDLVEWARGKVTFLLESRPDTREPLLAERYTPTGGLVCDGGRVDTDTIYLLRSLWECRRLGGGPGFSNAALPSSTAWCDRAWSEKHGHYVRKLWPDCTRSGESLYGDGKYNTLFNLVRLAAAAPGVDPYPRRLKEAWQNLVRMGGPFGGLVPAQVKSGKAVEAKGPDPQQSMFLDVLMDAFEATKDGYFAAQARQHARLLLGKPEAERAKLVREESGQWGNALLRLALTGGS